MPESAGFTVERTYDANQLPQVLGAQEYTAGICYGGSFNPLMCLQSLKDLLIENGMQVFESTEMARLESEVLGAIVVPSGTNRTGDQKQNTYGHGGFRSTVDRYSDRLRCRPSNAKVPEAQ